jgi:tetratricopeptide (TPR) repeat protein
MLKALASLASRIGAKRNAASARALCERAAAAFGAGRHREAERCARQAAEIDPASAGIQFLLGSARLELGELESAEEAFIACLALEPGYPVVLHARMCRALSRARAGLRRGRLPRLMQIESGDVPRVSVIICSIHPERFDRVCANLRTLLAPLPHEIIGIHDARSLCDGYNRGVVRASGEVLLFSHDDVEIVTPDLAPRLLAHLRSFDLVGIAGTTRLLGGNWIDAGWPHLRGQIGARTPQPARLLASVFGMQPGLAAPVEALDGVLFAARREVVDRIRFDEEAFDGWHLYDLDFSFSAHLAGFRVGVCQDVCLIHDSRGDYRADWQRYVDRFEAKHRTRLRKGEPRAQRPCTVEVASATEWVLMTEEMISAPVAA